MDTGLRDPVRIAGHVRRGEASGDPAQVLPVDAVGREGPADDGDDRHPSVAQPTVHVLSGAAHRGQTISGRRRAPTLPPHPMDLRAAAARMSPDLNRRGADRPAGLGGDTMTDAVIVDAVRTAGGKRNGKLRNWHAVDLASEPLKALVERNDLDPALVDDVIMGCVMQVGEQSLNVGRNAVLAAGWPESVPAHHRRPPVRLVAAGRALRRPGRHGRGLRHRDRRRRRGHDAGPRWAPRSCASSATPSGPA